jgi:hypothetical protein
MSTTPCRWCGLLHGPTCPRVKAIEYCDDGVTVRRVEFMTAAAYLAPSGVWTGPQSVVNCLCPVDSVCTNALCLRRTQGIGIAPAHMRAS